MVSFPSSAPSVFGKAGAGRGEEGKSINQSMKHSNRKDQPGRGKERAHIPIPIARVKRKNRQARKQIEPRPRDRAGGSAKASKVQSSWGARKQRSCCRDGGALCMYKTKERARPKRPQPRDGRKKLMPWNEPRVVVSFSALLRSYEQKLLAMVILLTSAKYITASSSLRRFDGSSDRAIEIDRRKASTQAGMRIPSTQYHNTTGSCRSPTTRPSAAGSRLGARRSTCELRRGGALECDADVAWSLALHSIISCPRHLHTHILVHPHAARRRKRKSASGRRARTVRRGEKAGRAPAGRRTRSPCSRYEACRCTVSVIVTPVRLIHACTRHK